MAPNPIIVPLPRGGLFERGGATLPVPIKVLLPVGRGGRLPVRGGGADPPGGGADGGRSDPTPTAAIPPAGVGRTLLSCTGGGTSRPS